VPNIRLVALCVFRHEDRILVAPAHDTVKNERFVRPLGGAIEFGELAVETLRREILEELNTEIVEPVQLGVLESRLDYCGEPGHQIAFVFDSTFADRELCAASTLPVCEPGWDGPAEWLDLRAPQTIPLYPEGLDELLRQQT